MTRSPRHTHLVGTRALLVALLATPGCGLFGSGADMAGGPADAATQTPPADLVTNGADLAAVVSMAYHVWDDDIQGMQGMTELKCEQAGITTAQVVVTSVASGATTRSPIACPTGQAIAQGAVTLPDTTGPFNMHVEYSSKADMAMPATSYGCGITYTALANGPFQFNIYVFGCDAPPCKPCP
jgi:hypothetical protein